MVARGNCAAGPFCSSAFLLFALTHRAYLRGTVEKQTPKETKNRNDCRVVGICGSLRLGSYTRLAVEIALSGAKELKCQTQLIDLRDYELVFCDGKEDESAYPKDVLKLREQVQQAQG